jgi:phosphoribosylamine--glycine ligase
MEKVGILVVSYGAREVAMIDAFSRSQNYNPQFFVADKQKNPFNAKIAKEHVVIPDLNIQAICDFAKKNKDEIDFGIVGPEGPIVDGVRDLLEKENGIPIICPTKEFALEGSKVTQRKLIERCYPKANPRFKVFDKKDYKNVNDVKKDVFSWLDEFDNQVAVKPDRPATGKGVGVWGDHFRTREELFEHFLSIYNQGPVIIEEKIEGEEFSLQFFSDGRNLVETPAVRDYKRAFDADKGPNTGGMGSYKDVDEILPFMNKKDWIDGLEIGNRIFRELKGDGRNTGLWGVPLYMAYTVARDGLKVFEINSRAGMPEIQNLLPIIKDDFVDVCFNIIDGNLTKIEFEDQASVVIYKVPPTYGGKEKEFTGDTRVDLSGAYNLEKKYGDRIRAYPCSMELKGNETFALKSRTVCVVGIDDNIQAARKISIEGIEAIKGASLWYRKDIASEEHIRKSIEHVKRLRSD